MCGVCHVHSCCSIHKKCIMKKLLFYIDFCFLYVNLFFISYGPKARKNTLGSSLQQLTELSCTKGAAYPVIKATFQKVGAKSWLGFWPNGSPACYLETCEEVYFAKRFWVCTQVKSHLGFLNDAC